MSKPTYQIPRPWSWLYLAGLAVLFLLTLADLVYHTLGYGVLVSTDTIGALIVVWIVSLMVGMIVMDQRHTNKTNR